ncbi:MAG: family 20 glycosylhydrolase [Bacteroidetes bacterium]|nr:family 20 glycosylhydrolase [Bacteroidota bacterium]
MKKFILFLFLSFAGFAFSLHAQTAAIDTLFPVRGLCLEAPYPNSVDSFIIFLDKEIAPKKINTIILRVDYRYQFESHPELIDTMPLTKSDVKKIVAVCRKNNIRIMPQINLLGHQSWASQTGKLLQVYPEFDETPQVAMPEKYTWPNPDELYCKSYCPLHPNVHKIIFDVMDELCNVFEADAFHAGMDEVFYLGDNNCPRCQGRDKAELFAGEVWKIRNHLAEKNRRLWIWGDRLLEGKISGLGMWEASYNNTHRAVDIIPKDVFVCDWHYEKPEKTPVIIASKGIQVATAPWRNADVTAQQVKDMAQFRNDAAPQIKENYAGLVQTVWSPTVFFMMEAYQTKKDKNFQGMGVWKSFLTMCEQMDAVVQKVTAKK